MLAVLSPNPKRVRVFIHNGKIYEGGIEEAFLQIRNELGGVRGTDGVLPPTEEAPAKIEK